MDAFYASVEQRDNPGLRGKPVIVGSPPSRRGVVSAASYEARRYGVRSAMPSVTAGRLCPNGIFVAPRMEQYQEESRRILEILEQTGAAIERMSIDEAYLELTDVVGQVERGRPRPQRPDPAGIPASSWGGHSDPMRTGRSPVRFMGASVDWADPLVQALPLARALKQRLRTERGLTASIGIASNKFLAKVASDFQKPDGLTLIPERDKVLFLRPMPVRAVHGVGRVTEQVLLQAGIRTIGDLQDYAGDLGALVGSWAAQLKRFAVGEDDRPLETGDEIKSISSEETFERDTEDRKVLRACLREQAAELSAKLKRRHLGAHTVQVKVRYRDFTTLTRQLSVEEAIDEANELYRLGCFLLRREKLVSRPLRLLGLGVSGLTDSAARQLTLL
jgi:DNA polymerase-4